jgi:membrane protease YdiL (CAAX protease family)
MVRIPLAAARHPVRALVLGYLLAFAVPWTVWGTLIAEQRGLLTWHVPQAMAFWIGLPLACIVGAVAGGGKAGLADLLGRVLAWRVGWRWFGVAVLLAAGIPALVALGARAATIPIPSDVLPLGQVPVSLLIEILLFWLTEEAMWRGFALPRIQSWLAPGPASLVVGVLWALWHLPLFAIAGSFQAGLPLAGFFVLTVATAIILGWLYERTGGSVPVCAVYHGIVDVTFASTGVLTAAPATFWTVVALQVAVAGLLWWRVASRSAVATVG